MNEAGEIMTVVPEEKVEPVLAGLRPLFERHSGVMFVTDVAVRYATDRRIGSLGSAAAGLSAEEQFFDLFTDDEVKQALEDLPENFRLPVILADVEGFSYKEIAEMLDIPIGTVMSRLHRGRKAMQRALYDFAEARGLVEHTPDPVADG